MFKLLSWALLIATCFFAAYAARAAEIHPPAAVIAGTAFTIPTAGAGKATFYLVGPTYTGKREVQLGQAIEVNAEEVRSAGQYTVVLRSSDGEASANFYVTANQPAALSFLAHPSRIPVSQPNGIIAVAFIFDKFHNLVFQPQDVTFRLAVQNAALISRSVRTRDGIAWTRMDSSRKAGNAQFTASVGSIEEKRVIQQVASDPCNLRMRVQRNPKGISVETDPIRDCTGNPVPDGTVVTFTAQNANGKSTVDAPLKKGVARAELNASGPTTISVASGVVMGNEVRLAGAK
jgi:hypothetical protein